VRGFQAAGCAQDLFVTEADKIIALPADFRPERGAFVEPVAVAAHATGQAGGNLDGKNVVVSGAGTIGNLVAQACKCRGARAVLVADISDYRLEVARQVGVDAACNVKREPLAEAVKRVFGPEGFEIGAEVAGAESSLAALVGAIGKGGTILSIGVFESPPKVDMAKVCEHELTLKGSMMYRHEDFEQAVKWIAGGSVRVEPLVSRHFPFAEYAEAYRFIDAEGERAMKVMIDLRKEMQ
jgi:L-iditol 2-dehydrogenase/threonine 3-dehydrogenase